MYPFLAIIWLHRLILAPFITFLLGSTCRFHPSCSHYAEDAMRRYGALRGSIMAVKRVLRCHPWHEGGYDPVA